ncbi:hypothetical protein [Bradyrhizobium sp. CCBAU 25338]|uniref:hypothetical protein n=1 Tax=Bradyrhizobium sp. CCBAU 25338 TaxID=1641877 RepID=UPI00230285E4|nr:hypothetical protein [Bradyrhizobium sp. CCBAU 25338]
MRCSVDRIKASAAYYAEANGPEALRTFFLAVAGVPRLEDVPESERLRVNMQLRENVNEPIPERPRALAGIARRAFANMQVRK